MWDALVSEDQGHEHQLFVVTMLPDLKVVTDNAPRLTVLIFFFFFFVAMLPGQAGVQWFDISLHQMKRKHVFNFEQQLLILVTIHCQLFSFKLSQSF